MKKYISILLFLFCVFAIPASAHQPNYVENKSAVLDSEPTISKAYYGELNNQPTIYTINSTSTFDMYVNILSPDIPNATKNYVVTIKDDNNIVKTISSSSSEWVRWYEDFAGDWYWKGPEFKSQLPAGTYTISVQNPTNSGKYVLAIGEVESFPVNQFSSTLKELFAIKTGFFGEPWYGIFYGIIGRYLLGGTIILLVILIAILWIIARVIRKKR
jgi:hypothetical protein